MYCTKCGKLIPDDSGTCPECGCDLSYESNMLRNELTPRKEKKKRSSSHIGGVLVACAAALVAAECVFLLGFAPVRITPSSSFDNPPAETSQGVTELIPTADTSAEAAASAAEVFKLTEPTPIITVTPIASAGLTDSSNSSQEITPLPTAEPTAEPTPWPTEEPTPEPTEEPTPEPTQAPVVTSSSQIIPSSASEPISSSDLEGMSAAEARIARNEIYARHGLIFQSEDLQEYFSAQDWYEGTVTDADSISLSELEYDNIETIMAYEEELNSEED